MYCKCTKLIEIILILAKKKPCLENTLQLESILLIVIYKRNFTLYNNFTRNKDISIRLK